MKNLSRIEKDNLRQRLETYIMSYIDDLPYDNNLGYFPEDVVGLMTDAAFAVLMAIQETNIYMEEEDLLK